jgi:2-keto-3-deoxy-6-phosphogluconate aldolase
LSRHIPEFQGILRRHMIKVPESIQQVGGIRILGKLIRSLIFTTDVAIIKNCNADAVIAVYPFTPQPIITQSIINVSDIPVFCGVGGGTTTGKRVVSLATDAEYQGAIGIVVNAPTANKIVKEVSNKIDIPVIVTVASEHTNFEERISSGTSIFNVSCAGKTAEVVAKIRKLYPSFPIIATGGPNDESIKRTIEAGANAITFTPPTSAQIFKGLMEKYRDGF